MSLPNRANSGKPGQLVLAQKALEETTMTLLVTKDLDRHVLGHRVDPIGRFDYPGVVLDRPGLGLDHTANHVNDVSLLLRRLQIVLFGDEGLRPRHYPGIAP